MSAATTREEQALRLHAIMYALGMAVMMLVNLLTNLQAGIAGHWSSWWSLWALVGWGAGLGVHAVVVGLDREQQASR